MRFTEKYFLINDEVMGHSTERLARYMKQISYIISQFDRLTA